MTDDEREHPLVERSRERLKRFPSWISSGSQEEFDQWLLGLDRDEARVAELERAIQEPAAILFAMVNAVSYAQPVDPMRCHDRCRDTGQQCDLQPRHGGTMHSAVGDKRYWWRDSDGRVETFDQGGSK